MATGAWTPASGRFAFSELTGAEESEVSQADTGAAIRLLNSLARVRFPEWRAESLTASDRDRLLCQVYKRSYGPRIETTLVCVRCRSQFDLAFTADGLRLPPDPGAASALPDGSYELSDGAHFRLPRGEDEVAVSHLPAEEAVRALQEACIFRVGSGGLEAIEEAMQALAPIVDLEISTACPECGHGQEVRFDLQYYLLRALMNEQPQLASEMHRIASSYGWSHGEIQGLKRTVRRRLVALIEADAQKRNRS